jgi:hypothetical protein
MIFQIPAAAVATVGHHIGAIDTKCHDPGLMLEPTLWVAKFLYFCIEIGRKVGTYIALPIRSPVRIIVWP